MAGALKTRESRNLFPWSGRNPWMALRDEMDDLVTRFVGNGGDSWLAGPSMPSLDISETDSAVEVEMDVPGVKAEEIDIRLSGDTLTVSGEHEEKKEEKDKTYHRVERHAGSFTRSVRLPCHVQDAGVDAQYNDGVLKITLPKCEDEKSRRIKVKG